MNQMTKELLQQLLLAAISSVLHELRSHKDSPCIKQNRCLVTLLRVIEPSIPLIKKILPEHMPLIEWAQQVIDESKDKK